MPKILIAMPAYNESRYIGSMVHKIRKYSYDVLVLDDGSCDDTAEIARLAGATVISHDNNKGYGAAIQSILKEARKRETDALVIMDADSQHNPDEIQSVIKPVLDGFDIAIGRRAKLSIPRYRKLGQGVISFFVRALSGSNVRDTQSGFRAYSKKAIECLELKQSGMAVSSEILNEAMGKGLKTIEIPISVSYTKDSSTINPIIHGVDILARVLQMISQRKPLMFFGIGGLISVIVGIYLGVRSYNMLEANGALPEGTAMVSVLLLMVGILSIFTGIILNTLNKKLK